MLNWHNFQVIVGSDEGSSAFNQNTKDIGRFSKYFEFKDGNKEFILAAVPVPKFKTDFISDDHDFML